MALESGELIDGRYRVERVLGSGAFGTVYLVDDPDLGRQAALKLLEFWGEEASSQESCQRFIREAKSLNRLAHINIVRVYRLGVHNQTQPYMLMEHLMGESLSAYVKSRENLSFSASIALGIQIASALAYAHKAGLIHRDLKPENVFVLNDGQVLRAKVLDFGLCRENNGGESGGQTLTETGALLGTPTYMSPEQCLDRPADGLVLNQIPAGGFSTDFSHHFIVVFDTGLH